MGNRQSLDGKECFRHISSIAQCMSAITTSRAASGEPPPYPSHIHESPLPCSGDADQLVNLRLSSKQMLRSAKKCEASEAAAKSKLKKAIEQGNYDGAKIYAQVRA